MDPVLETIYQMDKTKMAQCAEHVMIGGGSRGGPTLFRGKGVRVWDVDDKEYIDCTSQSWALLLGYSNEEINQVIREHIDNLTHVHQGFDTLPRFYLADKLTAFPSLSAADRPLRRR